jgi:hypothetical protein
VIRDGGFSIYEYALGIIVYREEASLFVIARNEATLPVMSLRGAKRRNNLKEIATPAFGGLAMTDFRVLFLSLLAWV